MSLPNRADLHRNVQFIYERALAELELESFGINDFSSDRRNPWVYAFNGSGDIKGLLKRSAYFGAVNGRDSIYHNLIRPGYQGGQFNVTRSVNQYLTHWIYPYKGKFHPQMIRALLNIMQIKPGQVVLDPFLGSGTTAIECMMMGVDFIGIDISPLCALISRVKTTAWRKIDEITRIADSGERPSDADDPIVRDFFTLADMVTESDVAVRGRDKDASYRKNILKMVRSVSDMAVTKEQFGLHLGRVSILEGDVRELGKYGFRDCSVDAIVTSPPYSIALDYVKNDAHALRAMGQDLTALRENFIGVRGKPKLRMRLYNEDMKVVFAQMARVLKSGGVAVVVIGNATCGEEVTTTEEMKEWGHPHGLRFEDEMPKIVFGLYNIITDEKLLFYRKD